jgi:hypothetical protein
VLIVALVGAGATTADGDAHVDDDDDGGGAPPIIIKLSKSTLSLRVREGGAAGCADSATPCSSRPCSDA